MHPSEIANRIDNSEALDGPVRVYESILERVLPKGGTRDLLQGSFLGHPLHPLLTDFAVGFWSAAVTLDLVGGRKAAPAADRLIALGALSAFPTIASGAADWTQLKQPGKRAGLSTRPATPPRSSCSRRRGWRAGGAAAAAGVALGLAATAAMTVGGYLGGHLTFSQ